MLTEGFSEFQVDIDKWQDLYGLEFRGTVPRFKSETARFLELSYPQSPGQVGHLANLAATVSSRYYERAHFDGAWLWFTDDPFDGWEHAAGRVVLERIRAGFGDLRPFDFDHVYRFRSDEIELLTAFAMLGTVLAWDFYILSNTGDQMVFVSHDGFCGIVAKNEEVEAALRAQFGEEIKGMRPH